MDKMKLAVILVCLSAAFVSVAQASEFWGDFYVNFGDWNVNYPGNETGKIVDLGLDHTSGTSICNW